MYVSQGGQGGEGGGGVGKLGSYVCRLLEDWGRELLVMEREGGGSGGGRAC